MKKLFKIAFLVALVSAVYTACTADTPDTPDDAWNRNLIDKALEAQPIRWANDPNVNTEYTRYGVLYSGKALNYLALVAFYDQNNQYPEVAAKVVDQLKYVISGAKEPTCRGVIAGWADNALAQSILLAKNTNLVWSEFSDPEKKKLDLLMSALAIAGNYCQNKNNNVHRGLYQNFEWRKGWNPNHQEGYVGIMAAAYLYFGGADQVNRILEEFSYDYYLDQFEKYGFDNAKTCWQATGKELMEQGGTDSGGGTTAGVKIPFRYQSLSGYGELSYDPYLLYRDLASRMYKHNITSEECGGEAHLLNNEKTPYEGLPGMCYEFRAVDASGCRSSASYCYEGWMNNILTLASLQALDQLPAASDEEFNALKIRIKNGSSDLFYKLDHGYQARKNGKFVLENAEKLTGLGYEFLTAIYQNVIDRL